MAPFLLTALPTALPTADPQNLHNPILDMRAIPSGEVDLPALITAIFDGLANVIAASGAAAANTIAASGGAVANGLGASGGTVANAGSSKPTTVFNSTLAGMAIGEKVGRAMARDLMEGLTTDQRV